jgi:hypothetical protein
MPWWRCKRASSGPTANKVSCHLYGLHARILPFLLVRKLGTSMYSTSFQMNNQSVSERMCSCSGRNVAPMHDRGGMHKFPCVHKHRLPGPMDRRCHPIKWTNRSSNRTDMNRYYPLNNDFSLLENRYDYSRKPTFQVDMKGVKLSI